MLRVRAQHSSCYTSRAHLHKDRICATRGAFTPIKPCSTHPRYPSPHTQGRILGVNPAKLSGQSCFLSLTQDWSQTLSRLTLQQGQVGARTALSNGFQQQAGSKGKQQRPPLPWIPQSDLWNHRPALHLAEAHRTPWNSQLLQHKPEQKLWAVKDRHTAKGISRGGINVVNLMTNRLQISISPSDDEFSTSH